MNNFSSSTDKAIRYIDNGCTKDKGTCKSYGNDLLLKISVKRIHEFD